MFERSKTVRILAIAGAVTLAASSPFPGLNAIYAADISPGSGPAPTVNLVPAPIVTPSPPNPTTNPGLGTQRLPGPSVSYISGRFSGSGPIVSAPAGAVIPDDFCLPGKFTDCGDHLRDQPQQDATTVFFGDPSQDFLESRNSVWASAQFRRTQQLSLGETLESSAYSLGFDRRFGDRFLLGLVATANDTSLTLSGPAIRDDGTGLLYGAYFAFELSDGWAVDGRALTGNISHRVTTAGALSGSYNSQELHASLRLSGEFPQGNWRIAPAVEFATMTRNDAAYTDTVSGPVAASSSTQSFVTGTLLGYYDGLNLAGGKVTPYLGFEISKQTGSGGPFGTVRAGLTFEFANGGQLTADYAHGAIGLPNTNDSLLTIRFEIPF